MTLCATPLLPNRHRWEPEPYLAFGLAVMRIAGFASTARLDGLHGMRRPVGVEHGAEEGFDAGTGGFAVGGVVELDADAGAAA